MERRVVITGIGAITPLGKTVKENWDAIKNKECGIDKITLFDVSEYKTKLAAEVKNYDPLGYFEIKEAKRLDRSSQFAMIAAREAFEDSNITKENTNLDRVRNFCKLWYRRANYNARTSYKFKIKRKQKSFSNVYTNDNCKYASSEIYQ